MDNLLVVQWGDDTLYQVDATDGSIIHAIPGPGSTSMNSMAIGSNGFVYVGDSDQIWSFDTSNLSWSIFSDQVSTTGVRGLAYLDSGIRSQGNSLITATLGFRSTSFHEYDIDSGNINFLGVILDEYFQGLSNNSTVSSSNIYGSRNDDSSSPAFTSINLNSLSSGSEISMERLYQSVELYEGNFYGAEQSTIYDISFSDDSPLITVEGLGDIRGFGFYSIPDSAFVPEPTSYALTLNLLVGILLFVRLNHPKNKDSGR